MNIFQAESKEEIEQARKLFRDYEAWLDTNLCFQGFEHELASLPGKYAAAEKGRLFLAEENGKIAGCIALRKITDEICEMKRLFVRADFRGSGLGKKLAIFLIKEARTLGYRKMRLDTLPDKMPAAIRLYHQLGFREIEPYYESPLEKTLYLELDLEKA